MNNIFLSKNGLSMSDGNHIANMAKEWALEYESYLNSLQTKKRELDSKVLVDPQAKELEEIKEAVLNIAQLYRTSAWFREAIKVKNQVMDDIANREFLSVSFNEMRPQQPYVERKTVTEQDIIEKWSFSDRFEYLSLEAEAAHIGKQIHSGGNINRIRQECLDKVEWVKDTILQGGARNDVFLKVTNVYDSNKVSELFFDLQKEHRQKESRLNYFKARIKNELSQANIEAERDFRAAQDEADQIYNKEVLEWEKRRDAWNSKTTKDRSEFEEQRSRDMKEAAALKLVIPAQLEKTVNDLR
jgi:hypothetical protein